MSVFRLNKRLCFNQNILNCKLSESERLMKYLVATVRGVVNPLETLKSFHFQSEETVDKYAIIIFHFKPLVQMITG